MQIQEDISLYNAFRKRVRQEKKNKSKLRPGESQTKKSSKPTAASVNSTSAAMKSTLSYAIAKDNTSRQLGEPSAKHKKQDRVIVGLRHKTQPISRLTGFHSNAASDRFHARSHYGAGKSTLVARSTTSHHPRVKKKSSMAIHSPVMSHGSPGSPSGSAPDSLFDVSCYLCFRLVHH
jgi:hypothetical protein